MRDLTHLATMLGLTIVEAPGEHAGGYLPGDRTIRLQRGLHSDDHRSVLAHELGHFVLGHEPVGPGIVQDRQERAASEWAAKRLISLAAYRDAEAHRGGHIASMAHDLEVHPHLVIAYREMLERIDGAVYLSPRMGLGQWDDKAFA